MNSNKLNHLLAEQTKYATEAEARTAARTLGTRYCHIIESKEGGQLSDGPWIFYLEHGKAAQSMVRFWERRAYDGDGRRA